MNFIEYLESFDCLPMEGKPWYMNLDTFASCLHMDGISLNSLQLYGKLSKDENYEKMKISVTFRYSIGKAEEVCYNECIQGLHTVLPFLSNVDNTHFTCKECGSLYKRNNIKDDYCKECKMFKCIVDLKNEVYPTCSICQESTFRFRLECGHSFHIGCLANMNRFNLRCPNCRMKVSKDFIDRIFNHSEEESESDYDEE